MGGVRSWLAAPARLPFRRSLTAAGQRITVGDRAAADRLRRGRPTFQEEAWDYFREIGEVRVAYEFAAMVAGACVYFPAVSLDPRRPPLAASEPEADVPAALVADAAEALRALQPDPTGDFWRRYALLFGVPGECYLTGVPTDAGDRWSVRSTFEVQPDPSGWQWRDRPSDMWQPIPDGVFVSRLWWPHAQFFDLPTSMMEGILGPCQALMLLDRRLRAQLRAGMAAGIVKVPSDMLGDLSGDPAREQAARQEFMESIFESVYAPVDDESAPGYGFVFGPGDKLGQLDLLRLLERMDPQMAAERTALIKRVAQGLPIPPEKITGLGDANHWCVDETTEALTLDGWKRHEHIAVGDVVLTLHVDSGRAEWQPVQALYRADVTDETMVSLESPDHSSLTTLGHRWPVRRRDGEQGWTTSADLRDDDGLLIVNAGSLSGERVEGTRTSYTGVVWCPTTPNGTWLARRNGHVFYTGNSGWAIDEDAVRQAEGLIRQMCGAISTGYLRPWLLDAGHDPALVERLFVWYDPAEAVSKPDLTDAAFRAHDALAISDEALLRYVGIDLGARPTDEEIARRLGAKRGILTGDLTEALLRLLDAPVQWPPPDAIEGEVVAPAEEEPDDTPTSDTIPDTAPPGVTASLTAAAPTGEPTGVMVAFYPPVDVAEALVLPDGLPAEEIHLTLAYLGDADDLADPDGLHAAVRAFSSGGEVQEGEVSGVGRFAGSDPDLGDAVYASVDIATLPDWRQALVEALEAAGLAPSSSHGFTPHMTLTYVQPDEPMPVDRIDPVSVAFGAVSVCVGPDRTDYPLGGAITAAATPDLGMRLAEVDSALRARLQGVLDAELARVLERAGARARTAALRASGPGSRAAREQALTAALDGVDRTHVAARVLGLTAAVSEVELLDGVFADLGPTVDRILAAGQATALSVAGIDESRRAAVEAAQEEDRADAVSWLLGALAALAASRLRAPDPAAPDVGEFDATAGVPHGIVRETVARAGGSGSALATPGEPAGGVATGPRLREALARSGWRTTGYRWLHGAFGRTQPFPPHAALDGVEFADFTDPRLANRGSFPRVSFFAPGDHEGCACSFAPVLTPPAA